MQRLIDGFKHFREFHYPAKRETFRRLAAGQNPHTMVITCADSRVMPELIFNSEPGELFVYRNVGNVVPAYGQFVSGVTAAIEYAVLALEVRHIVVLGHSDCGAMKAVLAPEVLEDKPSVATWLKHADTARSVLMHNYPTDDKQHALRCLIDENIVSQLEHLRTQRSVAARLSQGALRIHGWVYDIPHAEIQAFDTEAGGFLPLLGERVPDATPRPRLNKLQPLAA